MIKHILNLYPKARMTFAQPHFPKQQKMISKQRRIESHQESTLPTN